MRETWARVVFGLTAIISLTGVTLSAFSAAAASAEKVAEAGGLSDPAIFESAASRFLNTFVAFTIWSNIIVSVVCILMVVNPYRTSTVFRVFRLYGLVAITTTGLVYNLILRKLADPQGWALVANDMVHIATPLLAVVGWLIFGPRIPFRMKYVWGSIAIGLVWITFTLTRGALIHWYTYPFVNVDNLGYLQVAVNCFAILVFAALLAMAFMGLDKKLPGLTAASDR